VCFLCKRQNCSCLRPGFKEFHNLLKSGSRSIGVRVGLQIYELRGPSYRYYIKFEQIIKHSITKGNYNVFCSTGLMEIVNQVSRTLLQYFLGKCRRLLWGRSWKVDAWDIANQAQANCINSWCNCTYLLPLSLKNKAEGTLKISHRDEYALCSHEVGMNILGHWCRCRAEFYICFWTHYRYS